MKIKKLIFGCLLSIVVFLFILIVTLIIVGRFYPEFALGVIVILHGILQFLIYCISKIF